MADGRRELRSDILVSVTIENAYFATQLIAFCSICQAAENECYVDGKGGRLTDLQQTNGCGPSGPGMTGCCSHPTANLHHGYCDGVASPTLAVTCRRWFANSETAAVGTDATP
jgi:hypothetical protein